MKMIARFTAIAGFILVSACASGPASRGTEVTRFHLGAPIPGQPFSVEPADPARAGGLEFQTYAGIVADELARMGFTRTDLEASEMVAVIDVQRGTREAVRRRSGLSIGVGGGSYGGGVGVGGGVSFPIGGGGGDEIAITQLDVKLKRRSEGTVVWEGRAIRADRPGESDAAATVRRLAAALFQGFPGESGRTIEVE